jgi:hypothetical protein
MAAALGKSAAGHLRCSCPESIDLRAANAPVSKVAGVILDPKVRWATTR